MISKIKTISGYYIDDNGNKTDIKLKEEQILTENEQNFIDIQITYFISLKLVIKYE